jgi:hypothetical protein
LYNNIGGLETPLSSRSQRAVAFLSGSSTSGLSRGADDDLADVDVGRLLDRERDRARDRIRRRREPVPGVNVDDKPCWRSFFKLVE